MNMRESIIIARVGGPLFQPDGSTAFEFRFGADAPFFAGHFPSRPVLPGVFQIEMTRLAAEWALGRAFPIREISKAKFLRPILPEELVRLNLKTSTQEKSLQARAQLSVDGQPAGETVLILCPDN